MNYFHSITDNGKEEVQNIITCARTSDKRLQSSTTLNFRRCRKKAPP